VALPANLALPIEKLAKADSLRTFVQLMPSGTLHRSLSRALEFYHEQPHVFFFESALDRAYLAELLRKADGLSGEDRELIRPIVVQELDIFHLMLALRGKLLYGMESVALLPFHLAGTRVSRDVFEKILEESDVHAMAARGLDRVVDGSDSGQPGHRTETVDPAALEKLAWSRFWRLAQRAFRRSHMGAASVVAYVELRRVEVANLITACEAIRLGIPAQSVDARLIPVGAREAAYV
jgi:vacuolar-type H+-ATPase subunit C/Vma6